MTAAYLGGEPVTLTVPLIGSDGMPVTAQSIMYRVVDQGESELVSKTQLDFVEGSPEATIVVDGALNTLTAPNTRELRVVELYVKTDTGTIKLESQYFIEAEEVLVEGINSFQGYRLSLMVSGELPNIVGWNNANKQDRITALIRARQNIGQLRFRYVFDGYQNILDDTLLVSDLTTASPDEYAALPKQFKESLRRAQVLEANFLLGGDEVGDIRRDGIMSSTVGESKQFFRPGKPLEQPVCKRAMQELGKWILTRYRINRT